ncbi:MAG: RNA polymerase sigma factor [Bryobacteraceae bacterium]
MNVREPMHGIPQQIALQEPELADEERASARDEEFTALVRRRSRFVFRVAYSILRHVQDSDDVVQETFLKVYRSNAWERMDDEKAYLARTAWRIAVRQLGRGNHDALDTDTAMADGNPEQAAIATDWNAVVCRVIDTLPEELRQVLALSSIEEMNSREIGRVMGIPEGTVRTRLARARQILRQKLAAMGADCNEKRRS